MEKSQQESNLTEEFLFGAIMCKSGKVDVFRRQRVCVSKLSLTRVLFFFSWYRKVGAKHMVYTGVSTMYGQYVCMIVCNCMSAYVFDRGNQGQVQAISFLPFPKLKVVYSV